MYAYHGCLKEEGTIGSDYRVDITLKADLALAASTDKLKETADYVVVNQIVREEMAIRSKLLEHVAQRILNRIMNSLEIVKKAKVAVSKLNPPMAGHVQQVTVELTQKRKSN